ncbi:hypothetical protein DRW41_10810 [Neobacillus piezotolerans]|uniref:Uncharacterized protein n=2 Tax=Neobacillus piezotolerans TaxID=2259171 RepID=A0A3D8GS89_9BACI|nr:hypothetical protein DRW41_10810 [Neobacillus piezotolerans]
MTKCTPDMLGICLPFMLTRMVLLHIPTFDRLTIDQLKKEKLAVIVHANPDNFGNIPDRYQTDGKPGPDEATLKTGDAGDRQACGVILSTDEDNK